MKAIVFERMMGHGFSIRVAIRTADGRLARAKKGEQEQRETRKEQYMDDDRLRWRTTRTPISHRDETE